MMGSSHYFLLVDSGTLASESAARQCPLSQTSVSCPGVDALGAWCTAALDAAGVLPHAQCCLVGVAHATPSAARSSKCAGSCGLASWHAGCYGARVPHNTSTGV
jgi:hypothetical protein